MAIFGDGLSNFIDGLSIGASINQGLLEGFTATLSIWVGNLPQEMGDFALLVRAGMTPFQALFYNYSSSNIAYIGFCIGCVTGKSVSVARWIFSVSGATTLFISLSVLVS
jgi:zinc transporter ZupT